MSRLSWGTVHTIFMGHHHGMPQWDPLHSGQLSKIIGSGNISGWLTIHGCRIIYGRPVDSTIQSDPPGGAPPWVSGNACLALLPGPPHMNMPPYAPYVDMGCGSQSGTPVGSWTSAEHWQNPVALAIGCIPAYTGGTPLQIPRWTLRLSQPLHHCKGFHPASSLTGTHHYRWSLYLLKASWVR